MRIELSFILSAEVNTESTNVVVSKPNVTSNSVDERNMGWELRHTPEANSSEQALSSCICFTVFVTNIHFSIIVLFTSSIMFEEQTIHSFRQD